MSEITKTNKKNKREKVALFIDYGDNAEIGMKKEQKLKDYCKSHNYEIIHIYRTEKQVSDEFMIISPIMSDFDKERIEYSMLLAYSFDDVLTTDIYRKVVSLAILEDVIKLNLVSLKEGIYGEDYLLNFTPLCNMLNKEELNNNPYLIESLEN